MTDEDRTSSHHTANGYRNPWPGFALGGQFGLMLAFAKARLRGLARGERIPEFPVVQPEFASRVARDDIAVTWVGHSTLLVQVGGANVLTDPMWSERASPVSFAGPKRVVRPAMPLESLPELDAVVLSHNHYDHMDRATIERIARARPDTPWVVAEGLAPKLRKWGVREIVELDWWQATEVATPAGPLRVTATPAQHFSARGLSDRFETLWCGFVFGANGKRVYFAGDTAYFPEFARIAQRVGGVDVALIPVGAYEPRWFMRVVHMNPEDALAAYADWLSGAPGREPPIVVPIHWGTFRLTTEPMDEPPRRFAEGWRAAGHSPERLWTLQHGETRRTR